MALNAPDTVYTKTAKGILEIRNKTVRLSRELGLVFLSVDGKASVDDLLPRSGMSAPQLHHALNTLVTDGYIKVVSHPGQQPSGTAIAGELDFTSPQAVATVNMEAASRALAAADAVKRAQAEARAALDARMRQESEARGRAQAETRAQAEAEARSRAEEAARAAAEERSRAEIEARDASDPAARAEAEARARAAAAAAVRAQAEARVRAEAEDRARALAETKGAAEEEARIEAEARTHAEQQAQARAAAEGHAREVLEAQVQAMQGVRALADNPQAEAAEAARARVRELEVEAERAREAARVLAEAEGRADEVPQPEMDIAERLRQINSRVQAARGSREASERQSRESVAVDFDGSATLPAPGDAFPDLQLGERAPSAPPPREEMPTISIPLDTDPAPAEPVPSFTDTAPSDLPVVDFDRAVEHMQQTHPTPDHVPTALERAMTEMAARKQSDMKREPPPAPVQAPQPPAAAEERPEVADEPQPPEATAAPAEKVEPTLDDDEPRHERLNIDRTAHDLIAETAEARRTAEAAQFNRAAIDARRQRIDDDARRAAAAERAEGRKRALWIGGAALVIVPALMVAWLQFTTLDGYIPGAQRALSERLNQPVTISKLRYVLLPSPRVVLEGVTVGAGPSVRAARVEARVLPLAALAGPRHFGTVDVHGASVDAAMLATIPAWTGGRTAGAVHVDRLRLTEAKLNLPGSDLGAFDGNVAFASNGTVQEAVFTSPKAKLQLTPSTAGVRIAFDASNSQIPFGPPVEFSHIVINGLVDHGQVAAAEFTGKVAGGSVEGALTARWAGPVSVQGEFKVDSARVQDLVGELSPSFSAKGSLKATGRFGMQGPDWSALRANPQVQANFSIARGELTNIDLIRAIQAPSSSALRGGRTPFDELSGVLQIAGGNYLYRDLRLASGPLNANGSIDVGPNGQLNGRLFAELSSRGGVVARSALVISGTVQDPQLKR